MTLRIRFITKQEDGHPLQASKCPQNVETDQTSENKQSADKTLFSVIQTDGQTSVFGGCYKLLAKLRVITG